MAADEVTRNLDTLTGVVVQSATAMEQIARNITSIEQSAAQSRRVSRDVQVQTAAGRTAVHDTIEALAGVSSHRLKRLFPVLPDWRRRARVLSIF